MSRGHTHTGVIPWTNEHGLNMDKFYRRDLPNKINAALDKACMEMFGFPFRDGSQSKSRGTVEQLKLASTIAEREQAVEQVKEFDQIIEMQEQIIQQQDKQIEATQQALQETKEEVKRLQADKSTLECQNEALRGKAEATEQRATNAEARLVKAQGAFGRLKDAVAAWVDAHQGLQRVLRAAFRLSDVHRDKIEVRRDETIKHGEKVLSAASESVEDLLAAADEMDRGKRVFDVLKKAVKEDRDPDELMDDGWER